MVHRSFSLLKSCRSISNDGGQLIRSLGIFLCLPFPCDMVDKESEPAIDFFESHFGNGAEQAVNTAAVAKPPSTLPSPVHSSVECSTTRSGVYNNAHHSQIRRSSDDREEGLLLEVPHYGELQLVIDESWFSSPQEPDLPCPMEVFPEHQVEYKESIPTCSRGLMLPSTCRPQLGQSNGTDNVSAQRPSYAKWPIGHSQQNASLGVDDVTCVSSTDEIEREIADAIESVSFQCTTIPQQEAGRIARDPIVSGIAKDGKLMGDGNGEGFLSDSDHCVLCLFKRRIIARDKLEHALYAIPRNKYQEIFPKIKKDEALVYHGTEFPMGEEDKTMLECSLHRRLEIADVLHVQCKMVLGHIFSVEEPCTWKVTVSEILSKSNERITAGFSVKIVINCHGSTDKLYEDKVRVIIQSGSTTLRLIFPVSYYETSIFPLLHDSSVTCMPDEDRKALRRCHVALLDNIGDVMVLCDQLYQYGILSIDDIDEVKGLTKRRERNAHVLRVIQTRGNVLDFFIKVMQAKRENQGAAAILQEMRRQVYSGAVK